MNTGLLTRAETLASFCFACTALHPRPQSLKPGTTAPILTDSYGDSRADLISKSEYETFTCDARYNEWLTTHSAVLPCRLDKMPPTSMLPFADNAKVLMYGNSHILQTSNALAKMYMARAVRRVNSNPV